MSALAGSSRTSVRRLSTSLLRRMTPIQPSFLSASPRALSYPAHSLRRLKSSQASKPAVDSKASHWSDADEGDGAVSFANGVISVRGVELSPTHLRDHCRCPECFHPVTHQRLLDTSSIPRGIKPSSMILRATGLDVTWSNDFHPSHYSSHLLSQLLPHPPPPFIARSKTLWTPTTNLSTSPPSISHSTITTSPTGLLEALRIIDKHGVLFIQGVPPTTEATEAVCRLLGKGKLQETHYGQFWDFSADMKHGDLAYSNQPLRPHTDTTYFSTPCGLQCFHLLQPATLSGGHTLLVDGFACADQLRSVSPTSYEVLRDTKLRAHAAGTDGYVFRTEKGWGVFEEGTGGELEGVRWNGEDRSVFAGDGEEGGGVEETERWYEAVREWEALLRKRENEKWVALEAGTVVVIDNHRVMHGRSAFTGERRMCGAYISRDDWRSHLTVLERDERRRKNPDSSEELEY